MDLQVILDGMSAQWQKERAETQMTLGELIAALKAMPADADVANLTSPHSFRGYYSDLAFEKGDGLRKASELLSDCRSAMGEVFHGYKGGEFVMGAKTPVWVAKYGLCGPKLMAIHAGGDIETEEETC
jgi:hypothetical protein